ncbi:MAG: hypothetical protein JNK53_02655 [Phycisphaerae bacterium]|nr:hypothetical protein [Phycisphaerae bacterium]
MLNTAALTLADASLPTLGGPALGALIIALIWGVLLLAFGATLLRPMVVVTALLTGVLLAVVVARTWVPNVPLWIAASVGGLLGVIAGALLYRPAVATISAFVGATVGAIVAWSVIATGALDTKPRESDHALVASLRESAVFGEGRKTSEEILAIVTARAEGAASADASDATAATVGDRVLRDLSEIATRAADRTRATLQATAPVYRTLLYGSILTGAVAGFLAGLVATTTVARILTSVAGATLLMLSAVPLLASMGVNVQLRDARAWLLAIASCAVLGVLTQTLLGGRTRGAGKSPARKKKPAPPATGEAAAA